MHTNQKRIFLKNLPPDVQESEVREQFSSYGHVVSIEIKHRKQETNQVPPAFAFVNVEIDDRTLNKCFQEFDGYDWNGYRVNLELAKESFLERLKREREEANKNQSVTPKVEPPKPQQNDTTVDKSVFKKLYNSSTDSSSSDSDEEVEPEPTPKELPQKIIQPEPEEKLDYVIKNNKFNFINGKSLKIESVGEKPIHVIKPKEKVQVKKDGKALEAEEKRKKSLLAMKNSYQQQKLAIKSALSRVDTKKNNKIIFDEEPISSTKAQKRRNEDYNGDNSMSTNKKKRALFEDNSDNEDENIDFGIKKQFEGEKGQKLLKLQSRFQHDRRFALDSRFEFDDEEPEQNDPPEDDEKQKQLEILEQVLGKKIVNKKPNETNNAELLKPRKSMLRYDPSKPEHSNFETKESNEPKENKKKRKAREENEEKEEEPKIEVSKETFYKVAGNIKQSLQEKQPFSLLSMFGRAEDVEEKDKGPEGEIKEINKTNKFGANHNPFRYDSSDSEDEERQLGKSENKEKTIKKSEAAPVNVFRREKFFFKENDERLQEAFDFLKKLGSEVTVQPFDEKRRQLKKIVRDKIKNNMRNHRPFRKKLGRHKMIKVKKAKKK